MKENLSPHCLGLTYTPRGSAGIQKDVGKAEWHRQFDETERQHHQFVTCDGIWTIETVG